MAEFIKYMVANHKFDEKFLAEQFAQINPNQRVLTLFRPTPPSQTPSKPIVRSWKKYRAQFLNTGRIEGGANFWLENAATLKRAYDQYGVPPEIIIAIIGVETLYGQHTGGFSVMEALASLAFHDPRRGDYFRGELEQFLLLSRENDFEPLKIQGSYAGAMGIPQFMPGSWRKYAVNYDGDNKIDLLNSVTDSIGSIGNYLKAHGWQKDEAVAHQAIISGKAKEAWLKVGILPGLKTEELAAQGLKTAQKPLEIAALIDLPTPGQPTEYWFGYQNFYVITRYNKSSYYAMAVFQLAEAIRLRVNQ
ncbi:MAG: lytic murein transglycosylase B [Holophagales bacterium]|nr:lytic murein transglycosylase B [Holophagales bacterium]